jgi:hypothetical protein
LPTLDTGSEIKIHDQFTPDQRHDFRNLCDHLLVFGAICDRGRHLRFVERLVRVGKLDWARRARTRLTIVYVLRFKRRFGLRNYVAVSPL